jgi:hypothetical protein
LYPDNKIKQVLDKILIEKTYWTNENNPDFSSEDIKHNKRFFKFIKRIDKLFNKGCLRKSCKFYDLIFELDEQYEELIRDKFIEKMKYQVANCNLYIEVDDFGNNLGRIGKYNQYAFSYDETIRIFNKYYDNKNPYRGYKINKELIKKFWEKYPDGMIYFG